jgi:hypothetical protein
MKAILLILALLLCGFAVQDAAANGGRQRFVQHRQRVVVQQVVVRHHAPQFRVQRFVQPIHYQQQFVAPVYSQQFSSGCVQQFNGGYSQQLNGGCSQFFRSY